MLSAISRAPSDPPPPEEARLSGRLHTRRRDAEAVTHHYDVSNEFYRLVLGPSMTYSCAVWSSPDVGLEAAQEAKHELVCRKLGLRAGMRLLDVGCGWGGLVVHAARHHGVTATGITLSSEQAELARENVREAGLADRVEIRLQDYRDVADGTFDAIASVGMVEHVGEANLPTYFSTLHDLLAPGGDRLLERDPLGWRRLLAVDPAACVVGEPVELLRAGRPRGEAAGRSIGRREPTMGLRGIPEAEVILEDLELPPSALVLPPRGLKHGFADLMNAYNSQRVGAGTVALGVIPASVLGAAFASVGFGSSRSPV